MVRESAKVGVGTQPQVFVSYARQDAEKVLQVVRLLEQEGVTVWRDGDHILGGQYYGEQIVHAIAHSRVVLLMCSPQAFQSDNVLQEVALTWDYYHRRYLPVWLSPVMEIPERFRYCLVRSQWIDVHSQPPERWLPQLLKAFQALGVETRDAAGRPGESPPEPRLDDADGDTGRRGARFRSGDRPIRGADWELQRLLGKGGFGEVWKAHNPDLPAQPPVALKFCLELDDRSRELLRHEADMVLRAQQQIRSDGIVPLLHAYLNNNPPCLEYPYIEGGTLVRLLDECRQSAGSFTPGQVQRIIQRIAQIVSPAHRATPKLIHRDLKPSNVLVERKADGKVVLRVTDFGIGAVAAQPVLERSRSSSSLEGNLSAALTGAYSPLYASPQQMRGDKPDPRDDVYALGVIWHQLLTGDLTRPAPAGRKWIDALRRRGTSDAAIDVLSSCFEHEPTDRPDDAGVLAEQLQALSPSGSSQTTAPAVELPPVETTQPEPRAPREPTRGLSRWVAAGALGLFGLLGVIIYVVTDQGTVRIKGNDPMMKVRIDGEIRIENLGEPITLRTGPHDLEVKRGNLLVTSRTFQIQRGQETLVEVTYTPGQPPPSDKVVSNERETKTAATSPVAKKIAEPIPVIPAPAAVPIPGPPFGPEFVTTQVGQIKLKRIPAGTFLMGSPEGQGASEEHPQHEVRITRPFYLGVTEVTRGRFRLFVEKEGYRTEAEKDGKGGQGWNEAKRKFEQNPRYAWQSPGFEQTDEHPVVNVSWNDAQAFLAWLSRKEGETYRLPTEAEWEYACRAGTTTRYFCGDDPEGLAAVGNIADGTARAKYSNWIPAIAARDGYVYTAPVGRFQANAFGLYDMHGNVSEWCWDWFDLDYYKRSPIDDPRGPEQAARPMYPGVGSRVIRGGSWSYIERDERSAARHTFIPELRTTYLGFRVARDPSGR
jgi:formylglycine-generating enzyme required for sulfatase activity/serine/threonine protein kinase